MNIIERREFCTDDAIEPIQVKVADIVKLDETAESIGRLHRLQLKTYVCYDLETWSSVAMDYEEIMAIYPRVVKAEAAEEPHCAAQVLVEDIVEMSIEVKADDAGNIFWLGLQMSRESLRLQSCMKML